MRIINRKEMSQVIIDELYHTLEKYNFIKFYDEIFKKIGSLEIKESELKDDVIKLINGIILCEEKNLPEYEKRYFFETINDYKIRDAISQIVGLLYPKYTFTSKTGILGDYNQSIVKDVVTDLEKNGYHIFKSKLNNDICDKILDSLQKIKFVGRISTDIVTGLDFAHASSNTYWVEKQKDIINIPEVQEIIMDPTILNVVQDYLKCAPISSQVQVWWSINYQNSENELNRSAQKFHQDLAHVKFLKVFVYLNDVNSENGPHVFVSGSVQNLKLPVDYNVSQRVSDEFIYEKYGKENVKVMTGKKGMILFEDTSGWHKGKPVINGKRIILCLEFNCSFYNGYKEHIAAVGIKGEKNLTKKFNQFIKDYPRLGKMYLD